jgi:hypothetical protein
MENQDKDKNQKEEIQETKYNIAQLGYLVKNLADSTKKWDEATNIHEANLAEMIKDLKDANFILNKLPEKVGIHLKQIIPDISNHIQEKTLKDFKDALELCNKQLVDLSRKIHEVNSKVEICQNEQLTKKLINLAMNLVVLIAVGSGSSYLISTYLLNNQAPSQVSLTPSGDVNVSNSRVWISESSAKTNIDGSKKKPKK